MEIETEKTPFNSEEFWELYDRFIAGDFRQKTINAHLSEMAGKWPREMRELKRPEKNWRVIRGWIALKYKPLFNDQGQRAFDIYCGDVVIDEGGWDRDTIITHIPRATMVSGPLINQEQSHDLFIPLFEADTIERAIRSRIEEACHDISVYIKEWKPHWKQP